MNINKFTQNSMQAVNNCERIAMEYGNQAIEQEHLLYALLTIDDSLIAKMIEWIFIKLPNYAYCSIIGLIVASPIAIVLMAGVTKYDIISIVVGIITLVIGYIIAIKLGEK